MVNVSFEQIQEVVAKMRQLGVSHLETPELKLTLTDEPQPESTEAEPAPEEPESFRSVHEHPDTFGGFVPFIKRDK